MIITYTKPTDQRTWSYFKNPNKWLFGFALLGNIVSGVTQLSILYGLLIEYVGDVAAWGIALVLSIAIEVLVSVFLVTAFRSLFEIIRILRSGDKEEKEIIGNIVFVFVLTASISAFGVWASINISKQGKEVIVKQFVPNPKQETADHSLSETKEATATTKLGSDTMAIDAAVLVSVSDKTQTINKNIASKHKRLSDLRKQYKDNPTSTWYPNEIKKANSAVSSYKKELTNFKKVEATQREADVLAAKSAYLLAMSAAGEEREQTISDTKTKNESAIAEAKAEEGMWQNTGTIIVIVCVSLRILQAFWLFFGYYLSGRVPQYIDNDSEYELGTWTKFRNGSVAFLTDKVDTGVMSVLQGRVDFDEETGKLTVHRHNKLITLEKAKIKAEQQRQELEDELTGLKKQAAVAKNQLLDKNTATQTGLQQLQQELREKEVKLKAELDANKKASEDRIRQIKQEAAEAKRKSDAERQRLIREKQEKERQSELDRKARELAEREAEAERQRIQAENAKRIAEEAKRVAEKEAAVKQQMNESLQDIKTAQTTPTKSHTVAKHDYEKMVDDVFDKHTKNGELNVCNKFETAIRNYKTRSELQTAKLETIPQNQTGKRNRCEKAIRDNTNKLKYAQTLLKEFGLKTVIGKDDVLRIKPIS